jgi:hypothetical protein
LEKHPLDSVDEDGEPFWGKHRRPPTTLTMDPKDPVHMNFVHYTASILMSSLAPDATLEELRECLQLELGAVQVRSLVALHLS